VPFAACAVARVVVFGRAAPLAVLAKPSDLEHGFAYALFALVVTLAPLAAAAPVALVRAGSHAASLGVAACVHLAALVVVGGDWMPHARLMAPIAPSLVYAFVLAWPHARAWSNAVRATLAMVAGIAFVAGIPTIYSGYRSGRTVGAERARLIELARVELADARRVASLDIGWLGAATDASIIDLAGVTDPTIAVLGGGHTSKHVDPVMLLDRNPDVILIYSPPRVLEARIARSDLIAERFEARGWLPLGTGGAGYVVLRRR
jgi:hypothetical protein